MPDSNSGPVRILFADDDRGFRTLGEMQLKGAGFDVTTAVDGVDAMEKLEGGTFDLLLLDILMPGATGWEVLSHAVDRTPVGEPLPHVLMVTGFQSEFVLDVDMLSREGAAGLLLKPFSGDVFISEVQRVLEMEPLRARPRTPEPAAS